MCAPPQACAHAHFPFLTVTPTLSTARLFLPPASGSHTRRAIRAGTGLSPAAATTVAHFSDDRGRIQARMVNGTPEISLSFSLARYLTVRVSGVRFLRDSVPLLSPVAFCSEAKAADLSIGRSTALPSTFTLLGLAYTGTHSNQ